MSEKTLYIIRGLPGSGKSCRASVLADNKSHFAADDYFIVNGEYRWSREGLAAAHADCLARATVAMAEGVPVVAVANTFVRRTEMHRYIKAGLAHGYQVRIIDLFDAGLSDAELAARNVHGVPVEKIALMRARYQRM